MKNKRLATQQIHGKMENRTQEGPCTAPIFQASSFESARAEDLADIFQKRKFGYIYSRIQNPTIAHFEERLQILDGGIGAIALSSGMAAISTALLAILKQGDELVTGNSLFGGTYSLFTHLFSRFGIQVTYVEPTDAQALKAAISPKTKALYVETIGNPKIDVPDIAVWSAVAKEAGLPLIVDNTVAPGLLDAKGLGVDILVYSTSKYINGNGNAIGGAIVDLGTFRFASEHFEEFKPYTQKFGPLAFLAKARKEVFMNLGGCLAPQNAFLQAIGLETLEMRMKQHSHNALAVAQFLESSDKVKAVRYPGLASHPQYSVAQKQFAGQCSGLLTLDVGTQEKAFAAINARSFTRNLSNIGDAKTLLLHPASTIYADYDEETRLLMGVTPGLIRVSIGIENTQDLLEEFESILKAV